MNAAAREARARLERAKAEMKSAEAAVTALEARCSHRWGDPVSTPIVRPGYMYQDLMGHFTVDRDGHVNAPERWVPEERTPCWTRECAECGKKESTTQTTPHVTHSPKFG